MAEQRAVTPLSDTEIEAVLTLAEDIEDRWLGALESEMAEALTRLARELQAIRAAAEYVRRTHNKVGHFGWERSLAIRQLVALLPEESLTRHAESATPSTQRLKARVCDAAKSWRHGKSMTAELSRAVDALEAFEREQAEPE